MRFAVDLPELRWLFEDFAYNILFSSLLPASVCLKADTRRRRLCRVPFRPMGCLMKESLLRLQKLSKLSRSQILTELMSVLLKMRIIHYLLCIVGIICGGLPAAAYISIHTHAHTHTHTRMHIYITFCALSASSVGVSLPLPLPPRVG
jgi:hypothetical protein